MSAHHFSPNLHQSPAPFSHLVRHGDTAYTAGIIGQSPDDGGLVGPGIEEQCESMLSNLETLLTDVHLSLAHVLRTTIYLTDYDDFHIINPPRGRTSTRSARADRRRRGCGQMLQASVDGLSWSRESNPAAWPA
ncbi:RidA family protein [Arthrobacter sp. Soil762]|uniref:RidA family protein n=1 Tax=Arthrobacter sp. Soil762 TaxID=1736401 RepID=UPI0009E9F0CF